MDKIKAGIIGATGYAGAELVRLLSRHPHVQVAAVSSVSFEGKSIDIVVTNLVLQGLDNMAVGVCQLGNNGMTVRKKRLLLRYARIFHQPSRRLNRISGLRIHIRTGLARNKPYRSCC